MKVGASANSVVLLLALILLVSECHGDGNAFRAQMMFNNRNCAGAPYVMSLTDYFKNPILQPGCIVAADGTSWMEEGGISHDLYNYAKKKFVGTSFILQNAIDGCGKVGDFVNAFAVAATDKCFPVHSASGTTSVGAEIRNNQATYVRYTDATCQAFSDSVQFSSSTEKFVGSTLESGPGYCVRGWFFQVYDATGQHWNEMAPAPTHTIPPVIAPTIPSDFTGSFNPSLHNLSNILDDLQHDLNQPNSSIHVPSRTRFVSAASSIRSLLATHRGWRWMVLVSVVLLTSPME